MKEWQIERKFTQMIEQLGGKAIKLTSSQNRGLPDRMCLFPDGSLWFVELKTLNGKLSALQMKQINMLKRYKQNVVVLRGLRAVRNFVDRRKNELRLSVRSNRDSRSHTIKKS